MEKLFIIKNKFKKYVNTAFTSESDAKKYIDNMNYYRGKDYFTYEEVELDFVGRSICYVEVYKGSGMPIVGPMYDSVIQSEVYCCADHAKESKLWKLFLNLANAEPENHIIKDDMIASVDPFDGEAFMFGGTSLELFNMKIKRIKVLKEY